MNRLFWTSIVLMAFTSLAQAGVIYSNLGPADSFNPLSGLAVSGDAVGNLNRAAPFTVGESSAVLETAELALVRYSASASVNVGIWSDNNGLPGIELASSSISVFPVSATLLTADFSSATLMLELGNTYWLVATAATSQTLSGWLVNNTDDRGTARLESGSWTAQPTAIAPAFRINGALVPEPGTYLLFTTGVGCILARRRFLSTKDR